MKKLLILVLFLPLIGCGGDSESSDALTDLVTTIIQDSDEDDYQKAEYRFYGIFAGSTGEGNSGVFSEFIIDNSENRFTSVTIAGSYSRFTFRQGDFSKVSNAFSSDVIEYDIDLDILITDASYENNIGSRFHFNYDRQAPFSWDINGTQRNSTLEFIAKNSTNAIISRTMIYPAKLSFFGSNFISQIRYGSSDLITSLTIDDDGNITGSDTGGCLYTGNVSRGNKHVNSYPVNVTLNNCSNNLNNGTFSGLLSLGAIEGTSNSVTDRVDGDATNIRLMIHNPYRAIYLSLDRN